MAEHVLQDTTFSSGLEPSPLFFLENYSQDHGTVQLNLHPDFQKQAILRRNQATAMCNRNNQSPAQNVTPFFPSLTKTFDQQSIIPPIFFSTLPAHRGSLRSSSTQTGRHVLSTGSTMSYIRVEYTIPSQQATVGTVVLDPVPAYTVTEDWYSS